MTNDHLGGQSQSTPLRKKSNPFLNHYPKGHDYKFLKFVPNLQKLTPWQSFPLHSLFITLKGNTLPFTFVKSCARLSPLTPLKHFFLLNFDKHTIADSKGLCNPLALWVKNLSQIFQGLTNSFGLSAVIVLPKSKKEKICCGKDIKKARFYPSSFVILFDSVSYRFYILLDYISTVIT